MANGTAQLEAPEQTFPTEGPWIAGDTVHVYSPDGQKGVVSRSDWEQMQKPEFQQQHGRFQPAVPVVSPDGEKGYTPFHQMGEAQKNGFQVRGLTKQPTVEVPGSAGKQEVPGLFSGFYEGPTGAVAPGESLGHAVGREMIAAPGRAAKNIVTMPVSMAKTAFTPPQTPEEANLAATAGVGSEGLLAAKRMLWDPAVKEHEAARESFEKSLDPRLSVGTRLAELGAGLVHRAGEVVPVVGPWVGGAVSEAEKGHIGAAPEFGLEYYGFKGAAEAPKVGIEKIRTNMGYNGPEPGLKLIKQSLAVPPGKAGVRAASMDSALADATNQLSELARQAPPSGKGPDVFNQFADTVDRRQSEIWNRAHEQPIERVMERNPNHPVDHTRLATEAQDILTRPGADGNPVPTVAAENNPREAAEAQKWLDQAKRPQNLKDLDDRIREINADLNKRGPQGSMEAYGPLGVRVRQAFVKAARDVVDQTLVDAGEQGVKEWNRQWGALEEFKNRTLERGAQEALRDARGDLEKLPPWARLYLFTSPRGMAMGISSQIAKAFEGTEAGRFKTGLTKLGRAGLKPEPYPTAPPPPPPPPAPELTPPIPPEPAPRQTLTDLLGPNFRERWADEEGRQGARERTAAIRAGMPAVEPLKRPTVPSFEMPVPEEHIPTVQELANLGREAPKRPAEPAPFILGRGTAIPFTDEMRQQAALRAQAANLLGDVERARDLEEQARTQQPFRVIDRRPIQGVAEVAPRPSEEPPPPTAAPPLVPKPQGPGPTVPRAPEGAAPPPPVAPELAAAPALKVAPAVTERPVEAPKPPKRGPVGGRKPVAGAPPLPVATEAPAPVKSTEPTPKAAIAAPAIRQAPAVETPPPETAADLMDKRDALNTELQGTTDPARAKTLARQIEGLNSRIGSADVEQAAAAAQPAKPYGKAPEVPAPREAEAGVKEPWGEFKPNAQGYQARELPGLDERYFVAQQSPDRFDLIESDKGSTRATVKRDRDGWKLSVEAAKVQHPAKDVWITQTDVPEKFDTPQAAALAFNDALKAWEKPETVTKAEYQKFGGTEEAHRIAVKNAINQGKISSHPDYPDLAGEAQKKSEESAITPQEATPPEEAKGETIGERLGKNSSGRIGTLIRGENRIPISLRPDTSTTGAYSVVAHTPEGTQSYRMQYKRGESLADAMKHFEEYMNTDNPGEPFKIEVSEAKAKPEPVPATPESGERAELKRLEGLRFKTRPQEIRIDQLKARIAANPAKWKPGDGVGWKVTGDQTNRGFQVVSVDPATKMATIRQVADTGLTSTGGDYDRIPEQQVHIADLVRDNKYNAKPSPAATQVTEPKEGAALPAPSGEPKKLDEAIKALPGAMDEFAAEKGEGQGARGAGIEPLSYDEMRQVAAKVAKQYGVPEAVLIKQGLYLPTEKAPNLPEDINVEPTGKAAGVSEPSPQPQKGSLEEKPAPTEAAKAPYEMTQDEYHQWRSSNGFTDREANNQLHHSQVESALQGKIGSIKRDAQGNPIPREGATGISEPYQREATVPPEVLADYPDLKPAETAPVEGKGKETAAPPPARLTPKSKVGPMVENLPGMESAVEEQKAAAQRQIGENLTQTLKNPPEMSISKAAGEMERSSPLFAGNEEVQGQKQMFSATPVSKAAPPPEGIVEAPLNSLRINPDKFQFKRDVGAGGVSGKLKAAQEFDPFAGGVLSVWREPESGTDYVVNGHHRYDLASRMGEESAPVRYIKADTAEGAMVQGAIQNIREGQGTAVDAAKIFRMMPQSAEEVAKLIGLSDAKIDDAVALSKLSDPIWKRVYNGEIKENVGKIIGASVESPEAQEAALKMIESKGADLTDEEAKYAIRYAKGSGSVVTDEPSLFGTQQLKQSLALEKARLASAINKVLGSEKSIFSAVSRGAGSIKEKGVGEVNQAEAKTVAQNAAQARELFDKLSDKAGPIGDALNAAAEKLAKGGDRNEVRNQLYRDVIHAVSKSLGHGST